MDQYIVIRQSGSGMFSRLVHVKNGKGEETVDTLRRIRDVIMNDSNIKAPQVDSRYEELMSKEGYITEVINPDFLTVT